MKRSAQRPSSKVRGGRDGLNGLAAPNLCYAPGAHPAPLWGGALRHARGPDLPGAVLLPSPRHGNACSCITAHCWSPPAKPARRCTLRRNQKKGIEEHGKNATPHGSPSCCSDRSGDSCCDRHSARCPMSCSTNRRAPAFQAAAPVGINQRIDDSRGPKYSSAPAAGRGRAPPHPLWSAEAPEWPSAEPAQRSASNRGRTQHHTEAQAEVPIVRVRPVAIGTARVVRRAVPRTAAHQPQDFITSGHVIAP